MLIPCALPPLRCFACLLTGICGRCNVTKRLSSRYVALCVWWLFKICRSLCLVDISFACLNALAGSHDKTRGNLYHKQPVNLQRRIETCLNEGHKGPTPEPGHADAWFSFKVFSECDEYGKILLNSNMFIVTYWY